MTNYILHINTSLELNIITFMIYCRVVLLSSISRSSGHWGVYFEKIILKL